MEQLSLDDLVEQFKQVPDFDRFPLPEVIYEKYNIKKPKASYEIMEALTYQTPPHQSLNKNGKVELRGPAEGGVREIKEFMELPVEVKMLTDEELEEANKPTDQNGGDKQLDSVEEKLNRPTEGDMKDSLPE
jgi:hypothetical protein